MYSDHNSNEEREREIPSFLDGRALDTGLYMLCWFIENMGRIELYTGCLRTKLRCNEVAKDTKRTAYKTGRKSKK